MSTYFHQYIQRRLAWFVVPVMVLGLLGCDDGPASVRDGTDSGFEGRTGLYYDTIEVSILS
jgi:hypothetical protein